METKEGIKILGKALLEKEEYGELSPETKKDLKRVSGKECFVCGSEEGLTPLDTPQSDKYICEECRSHMS